jgi:hypothetical protein
VSIEGVKKHKCIFCDLKSSSLTHLLYESQAARAQAIRPVRIDQGYCSPSESNTMVSWQDDHNLTTDLRSNHIIPDVLWAICTGPGVCRHIQAPQQSNRQSRQERSQYMSDEQCTVPYSHRRETSPGDPALSEINLGALCHLGCARPPGGNSTSGRSNLIVIARQVKKSQCKRGVSSEHTYCS